MLYFEKLYILLASDIEGSISAMTCHTAQQAQCRCSSSWARFTTPQRWLWRQRNGDGNWL